MKRRNTKIIALIAALSLSTSLIVGATPPKVGDNNTKDKLVNLLKEEIKKKGVENSKNLVETLKEKFGVDYFDDNATKEKENKNELVRIIVQLTASPAAEKNSSTYDAKAQKSEDAVLSSQKSIIKKVEAITGTKVKRNFGYLVNGFSIETKRGNIDAIKGINGVKNVTEVTKYYPDMEYAKEITEATKVWKDLGLKGEGMVVSIIDTGIDFTHKDFKNIDSSKIKLNSTEIGKKLSEVKGGKYFTEKVPFGYNYADGNNDIIDKGSEHGQHVAGIVAANGDATPSLYDAVKGVAPEAQLLAMKVFSNNTANTGAYSDDIIAAIEDSVKLGADVINMSLGSNSGFMDNDDPQQIAVQNATNAGVICSISAGNSQISDTTNGNADPKSELGLVDNGMLGSPGTSEGAITVASMENLQVATSFIDAKSSKGYSSSIAFAPINGSDLSKFESSNEVVFCGLGNEDDFKDKDVNGKIALIQRGVISFSEKYKKAISKGAKAVIIFNSNSGGDSLINMSVDSFDPSKPAFFIGLTAGNTIKDKVASGDNLFSFKSTGNIGPLPNVNKDKMSFFSSWGPTPNLELKPDITAPGGMIYSLANNNGYQNMSGTSMSSPHNAGGQALIMQAIKNKNLGLTGKDLVEFTKYTSMNTATPLVDKRVNFPYSPRVQGAGVLQIEKAINNNVIATDSRGKANLAFKNVGNSTEFTIKLKNYGNEAVTYNLSNEQVYTQYNSNGVIYNKPLNDAYISFTTNSVTVSSKGEATITGKLVIPENIDKQIYVEGFISLKSTNTNVPTIGLPFLGFYGDFDAEAIVDDIATKDGKSILNSTYLGDETNFGFIMYGEEIDKDGKSYVDNSKVAISPNGDETLDKAMLQSYLFRNAKEYKIEVLNSEGKVVQTPYLESNKRKNNLSSFFLNGSITKTYAWDGTLYNPSTGKNEVAEDGQYTIRLVTTSDFEGGKPQSINFPIKVDTLAPEVKLDKVSVVDDKSKAANYKLSWTASDSSSGIMEFFAIGVNDDLLILSGDQVEFKDGVYSASIPFKAGTTNDITIVSLDNAGNIDTDFASLKADEPQVDFSFSNIYDGILLNAYSVTNNTLPIFGYVGPNTTKLTVNDVEMYIEDSRFIGEIPLVEGENTLTVKAFNSKNIELSKEELKVYLDIKAPTLNITPDIGMETPFYTVDTPTLNLKVNSPDKDVVGGVLLSSEGGLQMFNLDENGNADINAKLALGLNLLRVSIIDGNDNITTKDMLVNRVPSLNELIVTLNIPSFYVVSPTSEDVKDGKLTIKGFVNTLPKELKIGGKDVVINKDLTFETQVELVDGSNRISLYAVDTNDKIVYNHSYRVLYDSKAPTISFKDLKPEASDEKIYVNDKNFVLEGDVTDNLYGYTLSINGDVILSVDKYPSEDPNQMRRSFKESYTLKEGENIFNINITDQFGNETSDNLTVVLDTKAPTKPAIKLSNYNLTNKPVTVSLEYDKNDVVKAEYSFDGENYFEYINPFEVSNATKLFARVYDKAGNVSEITKSYANVDIVAPNKVVISGVSDKGEYFDPVKISLTSDDKDAIITATLNGKEYKGEEISADGSYELIAYATDKAGNKSEETKITFKITKKEGGKLVQTGSNTSNGSYVFVGLLLVAAGAIIVYSQRKKKVTE